MPQPDADRVGASGPAKDQDERVEVYPTKALAQFVAALSYKQDATLLDLGPVVGSNITFFGEQLGCRVFVEDLWRDIDRHLREDRLAEFATFLQQRFPQQSDSIDGVICWDVFDYLERPAAEVLARELTRILRPDGLLLAFFSSSTPPDDASATYTRHVVVDASNLQHRRYPAIHSKRRPLSNREIQRLFQTLQITDQFLLKNNVREILLRKSAATSAAELSEDGRTADDNDNGSLWLAAESMWRDCTEVLITLKERLERLDSRFGGRTDGIR